MRALSACRMSLGHGNTTIDAKPIEKVSTWNALEEEHDLDEGVIEPTTKFYDSLIDSAVPLDPRALACLQGSSLALDIYTWLSHRLHCVSRISGDRVSWSNLVDQFGPEYNEIKEFKKTFQKALVQVRAVYPDARLDDVRGGYILLPSRPPVPPRPSIAVPAKIALIGSLPAIASSTKASFRAIIPLVLKDIRDRLDSGDHPHFCLDHIPRSSPSFLC